LRDDVEITADTVPGLSVASDGAFTVALDITLSEELLQEGIARELVSRIQTLRKETGWRSRTASTCTSNATGTTRSKQAVRPMPRTSWPKRWR
jgi:hypothetical protein